VWTCLQCGNGFGLSADFTQCLPCPNVCLTCYMAANNSCTSVVNATSCGYYTDITTNACVQNCSIDNFAPLIKNDTLYCAPVTTSGSLITTRLDSAVYTMPDNTKHVMFVLSKPLNNTNTISIPVYFSSST
jgi:hypothetical protein